MGIIKVMSESLSNKIAAGEVVERCANVVKELTENSIDAGSKNIKILLKSSGIKEITVIDDGCGMDKDDAILSFERHATSKIKNESDLYFISTLGFRGEALASIASVSKVTMETKKSDEGIKIFIEGGNLIKTENASSHNGTIISIKDIFYNTPVRLKFLKSEPAELACIVSILEKISLSHPEIAFTLLNNEKEVLKTTGSGDLLKVIHEIFGYNISKNMLKVETENYDYKISGYMSNISICKSNKNGIVILVNGRVVQNNFIIKIIKEAYHTFMPDNKFPICILNIETDPTLIDVNIHPTKQEIKFSKSKELENLLFKVIRNKLNGEDVTFKAYEETQTNDKIEESSDIKEEPKHTYEEMVLNFNINEVEEEITLEKKVEEKHSLINVVGLALGTYLICEDENTMYMIDIHAANERINYEKYLEELKNQKKESMDLLFPINIELSKNEYLILKDYEYILDDMGIRHEEFGINTIRILSTPIWLKEGYEEEQVRKIIDLITELKDDFDRVRFNDRVAMTLACKSSVKANTSITEEEKEILIDRLFKCEFPYSCPHGRPTIIKYPKYELEKLFKRAD